MRKPLVACSVLFACVALWVVLPGCRAPHDGGSSGRADGRAGDDAHTPVVEQLTRADAAAAEQDLMLADAAFERDTSARRLAGWLSWYAEDAVRMEIDGFLARGRDAIRANDAALFDDPALSLDWQPTDAGVDPDGRHGWTRGRYSVLRSTGSGVPAVESSGHYLTIWRREASGWKVVLDTGVVAREPAD